MAMGDPCPSRVGNRRQPSTTSAAGSTWARWQATLLTGARGRRKNRSAANSRSKRSGPLLPSMKDVAAGRFYGATRASRCSGPHR
ncbi:hypothetical protein [Ornithinimicrobium kibberense]|uniref:hypothetical protein n=1 Tax=Ornithinimicrobium kibberense TaxID=282060 RepID=UPI00360FD9F0